MNSIFFLLPIILIGFIIPAHAEIEKGFNFDRELIQTLPDGRQQFIWTSTPERVWDGGEFVEYIFFDNPNTLQVQSQHGSVSLDKDSCGFTFYKRELTGNPLFTDSIIPRMANIDTDDWTNINQIINADCNAYYDSGTTSLVAQKSASGIGMVEYKYILNQKEWKTQLEATNLSSLTNKKFGFTQTIDLNKDNINFGGTSKNLDNFDGVTFDRNFLVDKKAKVIDFLDGGSFDFDLAFDNLWAVSIYDTGINKSKLAFDYSNNATNVLPGNTLILDPTFSYATGTNYNVRDASSATTACGTNPKSTTSSNYIQLLDADNSGDYCEAMAIQWDISSITDGATVDNVNVRYDITDMTGSPECAWRAMETQPSGLSASDLWDDVVDGTIFVASDANCNTIANNYVLDLGSGADADVQANLAGADSAWWAVSVYLTPFVRDSAGHEWNGIPVNELEITYTEPVLPDEVDDLVSDNTANTTVDLNWTEPDLHSQSLITYRVNQTTPWGTPLTYVINTTDSDYQVTGLSQLTPYTFRVEALTLVGWNATGLKLNVTTTSFAPQADRVTPLTGGNITVTTLDIDWSQPNLRTGNLTGYQVNYTTPWGTPLTIITNNTNRPDTTAAISSLSELTQYTFRVGVWTEGPMNATGFKLNVTTSQDVSLSNFTLGAFDINATNTDVVPIMFERIDINSTALFLNVTYPDTWQLACDFSYEFANINQTYTNLSSVVIDDDNIESSFQFNNVDNEIIDVYCWDESNLLNDGTYIITQLTFPLLTQIADFRSGEFGTAGQFGALDFVTLAVVIISMIGFNRLNESVGAIFNIALLGVLGYFSIIEIPTIIFGAIAVMVMFVISTTRKK